MKRLKKAAVAALLLAGLTAGCGGGPRQTAEYELEKAAPEEWEAHQKAYEGLKKAQKAIQKAAPNEWRALKTAFEKQEEMKDAANTPTEMREAFDGAGMEIIVKAAKAIVEAAPKEAAVIKAYRLDLFVAEIPLKRKAPDWWKAYETAADMSEEIQYADYLVLVQE